MLHWETSTLFTASWYLSDGLNLDKIGNLDETGDFGRTKKTFWTTYLFSP